MTDAECNAKIREAARDLLKQLNDRPEGAYFLLHPLTAALALVPSPPTLAEIVAAPGFDAEVDRAREILDAKDAGWNEGVEACIERLIGCWDDGDQGPPRSEIEQYAEIVLIRLLLIPTVPPTKEKP